MSSWGSSGWPRATSVCKRARWQVLAATAALFSFASTSTATVSLVNDPTQLHALDGVFWGGDLGVQEGEFYYGRTNAGIGFRASQSSSLPRNGYYTDASGGTYVTRIEFEQPIAGVGAYFAVSSLTGFQQGPSAQLVDRLNGHTIRISGSGYHGLICSGSGTKSVVFVSRGPMTIGALDIRPAPMGEGDFVTVPKNSARHVPASAILANDTFADGANLVSGPANAESFELLPDGSFFYKPVSGYTGADRFTYRATNGNGSAWSAPVEVSIDVVPSNSAPSFSPGPDLTLAEDAGEQVIPNWATFISAGADDEADQELLWEVVPDNPNMFAVQPWIEADGTLRFTPALGANGTARVSVRLLDDGGIDRFGNNSSEPYILTISIDSKNDAPILDPMEDVTLEEGPLLVQARATERDFEEPVVYSLVVAPDGATIDRMSGNIHWVPGPDQMGQEYEFVVEAYGMRDASLTTQTSFRVTTKGSNLPPQIEEIPTIIAKPGESVRFTVGASDEGESLRYALLSEIDGPLMGLKNGRFAWTPKAKDAGKTYEMTVFVMDEENAASKQTFLVKVAGPTPRSQPGTYVAKKAAPPKKRTYVAKKNTRKPNRSRSSKGQAAQKIK